MSSQPQPSRRSRIDPFIVMDVMRAARERTEAGREVFHLEVGQPGTKAPGPVREAARRALNRDRLGYTDALGLPELRRAISKNYHDLYGVDVPMERIAVTTGSSAGFVLAFLAAFDAGGRIAMTNPGYPCYRQIASAFAMEPVMMETGPHSRWLPVPGDIERAAAGGLDGVIVASPANPTGAVLSDQELAELIGAARQAGAVYISDEIYHGLSYGAPAGTALAVSDDVIVINSFSKYFCMTGWRVGWMVLPEALIRPVERLAQNLYIAAPSLSQHAAIAAFEARDEMEAVKDIYARNRQILLNELPKAGLTDIVPAGGAFYLYADISRFSDDSLAFARRMLDETGVAATPGLDFDQLNGHNYMRFSFAGPTEEIEAAAERLKAWLPGQAL